MKRIFILEGPDGCGKSVLATALTARRSAILTRHGSYAGEQDFWRRYLASMLPAYAGLADCVLDRSWLSEPIYGAAYRGGKNRITTWQRRMLERVALGRSATVVLCRVPWTTCAENFRRRKAEGGEMLDDTKQLKEVYDGYKRLTYATAYNAKMTGRHITDRTLFTTQVKHFNYTKADDTDRIFYEFEDLEFPDANLGPGIGAWRPGKSILLVGERPSEFGGRWHLPFVSFRAESSSAWLADQLEDAGIPEHALYWVNAWDGDRAHYQTVTRDDFIGDLEPRAIFALGETAAKWCDAATGGRSGPRKSFIEVHHPQYHKRFHAKKPYPLLKELQACLK